MKKEGHRLVADERAFLDYLEARLNSLAELFTNLAMSLTVVSFALVCLYLRVPTYVYFLAFLIPFFVRGFVLQWLSGWIRREFAEIYPGPPDR